MFVGWVWRYTPLSGVKAARLQDTESGKCLFDKSQRPPPESRRQPGRRTPPPPTPTEPHLLHNNQRRAQVRLCPAGERGDRESVCVSILLLVLSHTRQLFSLGWWYPMLIWTWTQYLVLTSRSDRITLLCCTPLMLLACRGRQRTAGFTQNALQHRAGWYPGVIRWGSGRKTLLKNELMSLTATTWREAGRHPRTRIARLLSYLPISGHLVHLPVLPVGDVVHRDAVNVFQRRHGELRVSDVHLDGGPV